ncbi:hypothetical protein O0I10_007884 [Lichtheimia ornata]|uniref:Yeast cell wall synthesis Kre9/Knh1-like N-terminal domain-containing protein n=1 Tax=Lichtheimia ornata TaxID=688661 RepID=A0AAD7UZZ7_9FUNG|nr:uncharacterized protein O0I10_007884 [Lichtheimia ornata]KAJ8656320.1 hypothetical protein O0I10_007884 [Lichtheimia ornata]
MPLPHTLHAANVNLLVTWGDVGTVTTVNILLAKDEGKTIIATLASNVDAGSKSANVKMPSDTPNGSDYFIVLQGNDNTSTTRGPITVIFGGDGSSLSSAAPSASSSAVSSSASNSASSSIASSSSSSAASSSSQSSSSSSSSSDSNSPTATSDESKDDDNDNGGLTSGQVAGIVVGVVGAFAVAGIAGLFVFMTRRRRERNLQNNGAYYNHENNDGGNDGYVIDQQPMVGAVPRYAPPTPSNFMRSDAYMMPPPSSATNITAAATIASSTQYSVSEKPHTPGTELHSPHQY